MTDNQEELCFGDLKTGCIFKIIDNRYKAYPEYMNDDFVKCYPLINSVHLKTGTRHMLVDDIKVRPLND